MTLKYFTEPQMKRIYHCLDQDPHNPLNLVVEILAFTGMRCHEALHLRFLDFDLRAMRVKLTSAKGGINRSAPISLILANRIPEVMRLNGLKPHDFIRELISPNASFESCRQMIAHYFKRFRARALIGESEHTPGLHGFRHTIAKRVYEAHGRDIMAVKSALGHKSVTSTERYLTGFDYEKLHSVLGVRGT